MKKKSKKLKVKKATKNKISKKETPHRSGIGITPIGDRVIIDPKMSDEYKTASGIFIPETVDREKPEQGKVVAVGDGKFEDGKLRPLRVKVGDKVVFSKYGYDEVKINDKEYYILREENILAVIS